MNLNWKLEMISFLSYLILFLLIFRIDCLSINLDTNASKGRFKMMISDSIKSDFFLKIDKSELKFADYERVTISGELPYKETLIRFLPSLALVGGTSGLFAMQHYFQINSIWKEKTNFRIIESWDYALYTDKFGHFWSGNFISYLYRDLFQEVGISKEMSIWLGGLTSLSYMTYTEIMDGYGLDWGFEPSDFYFDILGSLFFVTQNYVPFLQNITPKAMYFKPEWHGELSRNPSNNFIDNYSGQTFFLSFNVYNLLPKELKKYWIDWLEISIGYASRNLSYTQPVEKDGSINSYEVLPGVWGSPRFIIAFDYNLVKMLPNSHPFWNWFKQTLNYIKFPSPALEVGPGVKPRFKIVYPF
jgi:hypothetical protein